MNARPSKELKYLDLNATQFQTIARFKFDGRPVHIHDYTFTTAHLSSYTLHSWFTEC